MELRNSFKAFQKALKEELSIQLILCSMFFAFFLALLLSCNCLEWSFIILCLGGMLGIELANTALEQLIDIETKEYRFLAQIAKDTGSAAEFIFSLSSFIIVCSIFFSKVWM